jgi:integrase
MGKFTRNAAIGKPAKPHPDFPLFPHAAGWWCKKVLGKLRYFGKVADDPDGEKAVALWLAQKDDLLAGRAPPKPTAKVGAKASKTRRGTDKVRKPRSDFPLFPHARGYWAKKVRGELHYFGKVADDPEGTAALDLWLDQRDDLLAGRTPRVKREGLTVRELADRFVVNRRTKMESGELAAVSFQDYYATCKRIIDAFGPNRLVADLDASDFERFRASMAKGWSPVTLANEIQRIRVVFRYATENQLIPGPIRYGSEFRKPSKKVLRATRAAKGPRMFEADQVRTIVDKAGVSMKAMVLLAVNCGFGNSDVANLPIDTLDLQAGWANFPRPKTAIPRRCPLWKETIKAVRDALDRRPEPTDPLDAGLVFITKYGRKWAKAIVCEPAPNTGKAKMWSTDPIVQEFTKLLIALGLKRPGLGFYALRHTFETIGGDSRDQVAVDAIMGHVRDDMASLYREKIEDARLEAVTRHVHDWLFPVVRKRKAK